jgi:hypothetical protein
VQLVVFQLAESELAEGEEPCAAAAAEEARVMGAAAKAMMMLKSD